MARDDEYYDDDDELDEDEELDEEEEDDEDDSSSGRSSFNRSSGLGSSGTGGRSTFSGSGSTYGSSSRLPGSPGYRPPGSTSPFSSGSGSSGSGSGSSSRFGGGSSSSGSGSTSGTGPLGSRLGGSGSGSPPARTSGSTSGTGPLGSRTGGSGSGSSGGTGQLGSRPGGSGSGSSGGTGQLGSRPGGSGFGSSGGTGQLGSRPGSSGGSGSGDRRDVKPGSSGDKKDDKSGSGGLGQRLGGLTGGLGSRLGGGDKKEDKPASGSGSSGGLGQRLGGLTGGLGSRLGGGDKKDDKSGSGGLGQRLGGGGTGGSGGLGQRFGGGGNAPAQKKDDKPASGGLGGLGQRFGGFGQRQGSEQKDNKPSTSASSAPPRSAFGNRTTSTTPVAKTPDSKSAAKKQGGGFSLPFFGKKEDKKTTAAKPRTPKTPKVQSGGLTLDNKLDILGVGLLLGSLALFFSRVSATQGQLTGWLNSILSEAFGWGALAIPVAMFAVGVWLILRHFGEDAPVVEPARVIGVVMLYLGTLAALQYVETLSNEIYANAPVTLLRDLLQLSIDFGRGGGWVGAELYYLLVTNFTEYGGIFILIGWFIVSIMLTASLSAAELAMLIIGVWRSFSDARQRRGQRRAAAEAEKQLAAMAAPAEVQVSKPAAPELAPGVTMPAPALPASTEPQFAQAAAALPEPKPAERSIPITMGGRTVTTLFGSGDAVSVENKSAEPVTTAPSPARPQPQLPAASASSTAVEEKPARSEGGLLGGALGSRLRPSLPGRKTTQTSETPAAPAETRPAEKTGETSAAGGNLRDRLFGRPPIKPGEKVELKPPGATQPVNQPQTIVAHAAPAEDTDSEEPAARLGDLLRPTPGMGASRAEAFRRPGTSSTQEAPPAPLSASASAASNAPTKSSTQETSPASHSGTGNLRDGLRTFGNDRPAVTSPVPRPPLEADDDDDDIEDELDDTDDEEEELSKLPPAQPKGTGPLPRSQATSPFGSRPGLSGTPSGGMSLAERQQRLNAIRSGEAGRPPFGSSGPAADTPEEKSPDVIRRPAASVVPQAKAPEEKRDIPIRRMEETAEEKVSPFNAGWTPRTGVETTKIDGDKQNEVKLPERPTAANASNLSTATVPGATPVRGSIQPSDSVRQPPIAGSGPTLARRHKEWKLPDYQTLLRPGSEQDFDREFLVARARIIEDTLTSFGAPGKVVEINTGPVITQFGVEPDYLVVRSGKKNRVKVSAIAQLDKDLQLALGAKSIRIEAPVPGKGFVGIEVPNDEASLVSLRDVMESEEFQKIKSPLTIALGQSVDGTPVAADLSVMPHLLIAGTTGSGKSVCVNAIISSLVLRNTPDKVKFIMVDPKRVELTGYNGIPHLVAPVVVELERIVGVLKWVTREMDERYKRFSNAGARNIEDFNNHLSSDQEFMPYIIVIIDELADLMMLAPDETERVITRIAALARATGIHLVIATQRPSVDVVTGLIKANFPARIAFAVAGGVDSRVILDQPGAERLLGRGDMLYMSGDSPAPLRLQGVYVSDTEITNITRFWRQQDEEGVTATRTVPTMILDSSPITSGEGARAVVSSSPQPVLANRPAARPQQAFWDKDNGDGDDDDIDDDEVIEGEDEMYDEAVELVRRLNKASVSLLQRRLRIGYTRAARLIDIMEERGVVGPAESGSKPREVLPMR